MFTEHLLCARYVLSARGIAGNKTDIPALVKLIFQSGEVQKYACLLDQGKM